jgi:glutaredoxin
MEEIILYSTGCPKCKVLEAKLKQKNIQYTEINDMDVMVSKGFLTVPVLQVDGNIMDFTAANKWVNERN